MAIKLPKFERHTHKAANGDIVPHPELALANSNLLLISRGLVNGASWVNKFGENPDITAGSTEDVWDGGGTYSFPDSALITHISQATDQVGTDGGATIEVQGLDANWAQVTQTADLDATNTTTAVELTTPLRRVFRMKCLENIVLADDVSAIGSASPVLTYATIQAGNNQTLMAIYTVPAGKTAYMMQYYVDNATTDSRKPDGVDFKLWTADRAAGYEFQLKHERSIPLAGDGITHEFKPPMKITEKTDIKITATVYGGVGDDGHPHAGFDLVLFDN
jgi:hypothetical protein